MLEYDLYSSSSGNDEGMITEGDVEEFRQDVENILGEKIELTGELPKGNYGFTPHRRLRRRFRDNLPTLPIPKRLIPFVEKQREEALNKND